MSGLGKALKVPISDSRYGKPYWECCEEGCLEGDFSETVEKAEKQAGKHTQRSKHITRWGLWGICWQSIYPLINLITD